MGEESFREKEVKVKADSPVEKLIRGLKFAEPEHYHCPECNTLLVPHSAGSDYHFCPNCRRGFLILDGDILPEVA